MEFMTFEEAQRALVLVNSVLDSVAEGADFTLGKRDAELVVLGLIVAVRVSEHASQIAEIQIQT